MHAKHSNNTCFIASTSFVSGRFDPAMSPPWTCWSPAVGHCRHLSERGLQATTPTEEQVRTQNLQCQKTLQKSVTTRFQKGYLGYASSLSCARRRRAFSCVAQCSPKKMQQRVFSKSLEPSKAQFFFAYLLLPENFWSPVRPKILIAYCYRKIFGAQ